MFGLLFANCPVVYILTCVMSFQHEFLKWNPAGKQIQSLNHYLASHLPIFSFSKLILHGNK